MCLHNWIRTLCCIKYLGLNISQSNSEIIKDQVNYIKSVDYIAISNDRKKTER